MCIRDSFCSSCFSEIKYLILFIPTRPPVLAIAFNMSSVRLRIAGHTPVSYTHLDVYKRQVQRNPNDKTEINTSSRRIARQVLSYLDSADKSNAQYLFTAPSGKNTWDTTFNDYFGAKYDSNAVLLQIFHTTEGKVVAINFGKDGYMVTIVPGKETTCVYNGKSLKSIEG